MSLTYKFVELSIVSDDMIEKCVNQWVHQGWTFDDIRFVSTNASRRPVMAFVSFVRDELASPADEPAMATEGSRPDELAASSPVLRSRNALAALLERDDE